MKLNAYILAADPAWIEASVLSYYDIVDRIVVSYDEDSRGWTGVPIDVEQCLRRLRAIDKDGKFDYRPGHFARPAFFDKPMQSETHQRQVALDQASEGADWVLQLDTDEVLGDKDIFLSTLGQSCNGGFNGLEYPARWFYAGIGPHKYLELRDKWWRLAVHYPGPVAVAKFAQLTEARRICSKSYRVTVVGAKSSHTVPVHAAIKPNAAILHFSWARGETELRQKFSAWGHAKDRDWSGEVSRWCWCRRNPKLASILSPFARKRMFRYLWPVRLNQLTLTACSSEGELAGTHG